MPGQNFLHEEGSSSEIGNLHYGISNAANLRLHKDPKPTEPIHLNPGGRAQRR